MVSELWYFILSQIIFVIDNRRTDARRFVLFVIFFCVSKKLICGKWRW
jgi:hypothetical protein